MIEMTRRGIEQNADDLILDETQPLGATPPMPVLQEHGLRDRARFDHLRLQQFCDRSAKNILASGMLSRKRGDRRGDPRGIETLIGPGPGLFDDVIHYSFPILDTAQPVTVHPSDYSPFILNCRDLE